MAIQSKRTIVLVVSILASLTLCVALGIGAGGCGDADESSASDSTAGTAADSATTTTVAEGTMGISPELISKTKTLADVSGEIPEGKFLVTAEEASAYDEGTYIVVDPATIDPALQAEFRATQSDLAAESGLCVLWLGDENRGNELNAAVTNRLFVPYGLGEEQGCKLNFVGALPLSIPAEMEACYTSGDLFAEVGLETNLPGLANGVFMGLIPAASTDEPDTLDYYMEIYVPILDETFYARISLDDWGSIFGAHLSTRADILDLRSSEQMERPQEWIPGSWWLRTLLKDQTTELSGMVQPGDLVFLSFCLDKDLAAPFVDSRGVQYIYRFTVQRFQQDAYETTRRFVYPGAEWKMETS